ncbi:zinc-binding dehydrogenase [Herbidospora sp. NEAU-GS84]|uniref:Zinc-binding dehydrogenase n=1 Tax=Herbidospora solisilvae TaxID=2696284 RepID=A0A7C9J022_9ACTN|nr:NADP-dependent oxidoreductase [Herbidospora solisilvae]NAS20422.1 zinc-binding dehydrogenase [Herbidospora solisilvae]
MRAVVVRKYGGPEALETVEVPAPEPGPGQVRIRVEAAAVNPVDLFIRGGGLLMHGAPAREQTGMGCDVAGVVEALGPDVTGVAVGDRVLAASTWGGFNRDFGPYADQAVIAVDELAPAPADWPAERAAGLPLPGLTAWQCLDILNLPEGSTLLVTGAAGSVGGMLVQLAALRGLTVVALARSTDEEELRALGAHYVVDDVAKVRELLPEGVDAAVDPAKLVEAAHDAVRDGGQFVAVVVDGAPGDGRGITSQVMWAHPAREQLDALVELVDAGKVRVRVAATYPLTEAAAAHTRMAEGGLRGRLVLLP